MTDLHEAISLRATCAWRSSDACAEGAHNSASDVNYMGRMPTPSKGRAKTRVKQLERVPLICSREFHLKAYFRTSNFVSKELE